MSASELGELVSAFSAVTARLQSTHEALAAEVAKLKSELAEANQQVERSRRLAALGEMAAGIAHEVRNPLGSIRLHARMLREDLADRPDQQSTAEKIGIAVVRLDAVVGDVLAFAREIRIRRAEHDARDLLESAFSAARGAGAEWSGVAVRFEGAPGLGVSCDAALMQQALVNLARNAVEAMHEHASPERTLTLGVRRTRARDAAGTGKPRPMIGLYVRDTGPGITPEVMARMFNPFFTTRAAGTGLGLAIVNRIADAHSGRIAVRNIADGRGTVAELLIPAEPAQAVSPTA
ncbi:MAG: two-component system sensor histidine kinase NtrB [Phycisphaerales bacterium]